jgi:uncharacterized protein (DUF983 family)
MFLVHLWRALRLRCPACGERGVFERRFRVRDACRSCGHRFVREHGYWLGAMIVNLALVEAVFLVMFVGGMLLTWPDVPWNRLLVLTLVAMAVTPVLFLPWARTVWVAIDLGFLQRLEPGRGEDDVRRRNAV